MGPLCFRVAIHCLFNLRVRHHTLSCRDMRTCLSMPDDGYGMYTGQCQHLVTTRVSGAAHRAWTQMTTWTAGIAVARAGAAKVNLAGRKAAMRRADPLLPQRPARGVPVGAMGLHSH